MKDINRNYGCTKCQCRHYSGDALFEAHLSFQSKHGFQHSDQYEAYRPEHLKEENAIDAEREYEQRRFERRVKG